MKCALRRWFGFELLHRIAEFETRLTLFAKDQDRRP